jgi:hypothetical protein
MTGFRVFQQPARARYEAYETPSEGRLKQPVLVRSRPRSVMGCRFRQFVEVCVALAVVTVLSQSIRSQTQADPAAIIQSQEKQSVGLAAEWLSSTDPRVRAWGAYLALRDRQLNLLSQLIRLVDVYPVMGSPLTSSEQDEHDAMLAALDAIIQMQGGLPTDIAAKLYPEFPAQTLISLSRGGPEAASSLLNIFRTESKLSGACLAAGNSLMVWTPPGFAAAVLASLTVHAQINVVNENGGGGLGTGSGGDCASGTPPVKTGWPPIGNYYLRNTSGGATGDVLLQGGTDPAFYIRTVDAAYLSRNDDESPCSRMFELDRDMVREHFLARLVPVSAGMSSVRSGVEQTITWHDDACQFNRSTQHSVEVYWREFEILRFFLDADLTAAPLCPAPLGCKPTGRFSGGSIVVIAHSCFRLSHAARGFADRRNKFAHPWPW